MKSFLSLCLILLFILAAVPACTALMTINGKVAVAGHEPFTFVRIIDRGQTEYKLVGPKAEVLRRQYQQSVVTLKGHLVKEAIGPGFPAEFEVIGIVAGK